MAIAHSTLALSVPCLMIAVAFAGGCRSTEAGAGESAYEIRLIKGAEWYAGREGYRPELPGFVLKSEIGTVAIRAARPDAPDRLVLLIRTTAAQRPNLEGFTFSPPGRSFSTSPFSQSAAIEVREAGKSVSTGRVPLHAYFEFAVEGEFVRVTFLPSATELMGEECQVSWVDWYRR